VRLCSDDGGTYAFYAAMQLCTYVPMHLCSYAAMHSTLLTLHNKEHIQTALEGVDILHPI
jgi:hypothetical protein